VFGLGQCDKENHGWREGPPLTVFWQSVDLLAGPSPSRTVSSEREKNTALDHSAGPAPRILAAYCGVCGKVSG
jgi:hypothetical protein